MISGCFENQFVSDALHQSDNYSKFKKSMATWWSNKPLSVLHLPQAMTLLPSVPCKQAVALMEEKGFDQVPVVDASGTLLGVVTNGQLLSKLASGHLQAKDPVKKGMFQTSNRVTNATTLGDLAELFDKEFFAVVCKDQKVVHLATRIDLLNFITSGKK